MKKDMALKGIGYAVMLNVIIAVVPLALSILNILYSPSADFSISQLNRWHTLASTALCYSMIGECVEGYILFLVMWIVGTVFIHFYIRRRYELPMQKKAISVWFLLSFPIVSYLMAQVMMVIIFTVDVLKFGFV